jgi:hypothetical protein
MRLTIWPQKLKKAYAIIHFGCFVKVPNCVPQLCFVFCGFRLSSVVFLLPANDNAANHLKSTPSWSWSYASIPTTTTSFPIPMMLSLTLQSRTLHDGKADNSREKWGITVEKKHGKSCQPRMIAISKQIRSMDSSSLLQPKCFVDRTL